MGLDLVELVMDVEETFGVAFDDERSHGIRTAGDLADWVRARTPPAESDFCLTSVAFHRLRRGLVESHALERRDVGPGTALEPLWPAGGATREGWRQLAERGGVALPYLERPARVVLALRASAALAGAVVSLSLAARSGVVSGVAVVAGGLVGAAVVFASGWRLSRPLATTLPVATVGELARDVAALAGRSLVEGRTGWSDHELWETVRGLIALQTGLRPGQIERGSDLVRDLGLG